MNTLQAPVLHLNGTSWEELITGYVAAFDAVDAAIKAVAKTAPNGRDYYVAADPDAALALAVHQHKTRMGMLRDVQDQLAELAQGINREVTP